MILQEFDLDSIDYVLAFDKDKKDVKAKQDMATYLRNLEENGLLIEKRVIIGYRIDRI